jgi:hypothetical protein
MVRFSPRTITHLAAVEGFIKSRGGLRMMPDVMQHLVLMYVPLPQTHHGGV